MGLKFASIIGFSVGPLVLVILFMRDSLLGVGFVAILVQVLAVLLMLWARVTFGRRSLRSPRCEELEGSFLPTALLDQVNSNESNQCDCLTF